MFRSLMLTSVGAAVALFMLPSAAFATNASQAMLLCDKNPRCDYSTADNGDVNIKVGADQIYCPQVGECSCSTCEPRVTPGRVLVINPNVQPRIEAGPVKPRQSRLRYLSQEN